MGKLFIQRIKYGPDFMDQVLLEAHDLYFNKFLPAVVSHLILYYFHPIVPPFYLNPSWMNSALYPRVIVADSVKQTKVKEVFNKKTMKESNVRINLVWTGKTWSSLTLMSAIMSKKLVKVPMQRIVTFNSDTLHHVNEQNQKYGHMCTKKQQCFELLIE